MVFRKPEDDPEVSPSDAETGDAAEEAAGARMSRIGPSKFIHALHSAGLISEEKMEPWRTAMFNEALDMITCEHSDKVRTLLNGLYTEDITQVHVVRKALALGVVAGILAQALADADGDGKPQVRVLNLSGTGLDGLKDLLGSLGISQPTKDQPTLGKKKKPEDVM